TADPEHAAGQGHRMPRYAVPSPPCATSTPREPMMTTSNNSRSHSDHIVADEAAIRRQIGKLMEGLQAEDLAAVQQVYTTDVVSFDIEPPLQHVGTAAKLENWARVFQTFERVTYEVRDLTVTIGDD